MRKERFSTFWRREEQTTQIKNLIGRITSESEKNIIVLHVRHARQNKEKGNIFVLKRGLFKKKQWWNYRSRSYDENMQQSCSKLNVAGVVSEVCVGSSFKQGQRIMNLTSKENSPVSQFYILVHWIATSSCCLDNNVKRPNLKDQKESFRFSRALIIIVYIKF